MSKDSAGLRGSGETASGERKTALPSPQAFTPGPWIVGNDWPSGWIMAEQVEKGPMHVAEVRGWGYLTGRGHGALGLSYDEAEAIQEANARLIAAAPELYEALKALHREADALPTSAVNRAMLDAILSASEAIAKAEGR